MRTNLRRGLAAALVTPLLVGGLAACSDDEPENTSAEPTPTESQAPTDEPSTEPADDETDSAQGAKVEDPAGLFKAMQEAMKDAGTARVAMDAGVGTASGLMDYSTDVPTMSLTTGFGGVFEIELRYVGGEMYISMPPVPSGKFFKAGDSDALGLNETLRSSSPSDSAEEIEKALVKLVEVGDEKIDGEQTTHYVATIDTTKGSLLTGGANLPEGAPPVDLPPTMDIDMWLTGESLIRRMELSISSVTMQLDYTKWGEPVDIKAPAASDIVDPPAGFGS